MVITRSLIRRTVWMSCETNTRARPRRSLRSSRRFRICARTDTSSALVGSSATTSAGSRASARAMATRCRWPPESCPGNASASARGRPTRDINSLTRSSRSSLLPRPWTSSGSRRIRRTVSRRFSAVDGSWKTIPTPAPTVARRSAGGIAHRSRPWNATDPATGRWMPTSTLASVDFPHPDSPTTPTVSPAATVRAAPVRAYTRSRRNSPPLRALCTTWASRTSTTAFTAPPRSPRVPRGDGRRPCGRPYRREPVRSRGTPRSPAGSGRRSGSPPGSRPEPVRPP